MAIKCKYSKNLIEFRCKTILLPIFVTTIKLLGQIGKTGNGAHVARGKHLN